LVTTILDPDEFCFDYAQGIARANSATFGVTVLIAVINVLLRTLNKYLITKIGFDLESL